MISRRSLFGLALVPVVPAQAVFHPAKRMIPFGMQAVEPLILLANDQTLEFWRVASQMVKPNVSGWGTLDPRTVDSVTELLNTYPPGNAA